MSRSDWKLRRCTFAAKQNGSIDKGSLPTLRTYYDKLRREYPRHVDTCGDIYWPHAHYDATDYWSYDD